MRSENTQNAQAVVFAFVGLINNVTVVSLVGIVTNFTVVAFGIVPIFLSLLFRFVTPVIVVGFEIATTATVFIV